METTTAKRNPFDMSTAIGCKRVLAVLVAIVLVFSLFAQLISTAGGRVKVEKISIDARGALLEGELYYPVGTTDEDQYPAVVIVPGAGCIYGTLRSFAEELAKEKDVIYIPTPNTRYNLSAHPTASGHAYISEQMIPVIRALGY